MRRATLKEASEGLRNKLNLTVNCKKVRLVLGKDRKFK